MPAAMPVTTPEDEPTVAVEVLLLLQEPPETDSIKVVVRPAHTVVVPVIAAGTAFTVIAVVRVQPEPIEYEIVAVPVPIPVTTPVPEPMVPTAVLLLVHVPPAVASLKVVVSPTHAVVVPVMAEIGPTVTVLVTLQEGPDT